MTGNFTVYVVARDRVLRESIEPSSPRFPPFRHHDQSRGGFDRLNVFLVALNANIKFRRYFEEIQHDPPMTPLPDDVLGVMRHTITLIDLLYWRPVQKEGSPGKGKKRQASVITPRWRNLDRGARPDLTKAVERRSNDSEEAEMSSTRQVLPPEDADLRQSDMELVLFIARRVRERVYRYLRGPKPAYLRPLSWILSFQIFTITIIRYLLASHTTSWLIDYLTDFFHVVTLAGDSFKDRSQHL